MVVIMDCLLLGTNDLVEGRANGYMHGISSYFVCRLVPISCLPGVFQLPASFGLASGAYGLN
jgi:hypothetical protein